jgi:hypothetical protein
MKNILFTFSLFALLFASQTVEAQSQNIYRFPFSVDSIPASTSVYIEVPTTLLSLWTLGGSFQVTNLGTPAGDFTVTVFGTSDATATATAAQEARWQSTKVVTVSALAAGATSYQALRAANEMFYLGHTRYMIKLTSGARAGRFSGTLVLKKD